MTKKTMGPDFFRKVVNFLSHPAWSGITCFFTVLAALGLGGFVLAFVLGLFRRIQDLLTWLAEPLNIPGYVLVGGALVLMAFMATTVWQYFSSPRKLPFRPKWNRSIEGKPRFLPIPLRGIVNSYLKKRYINPPTGEVILRGVQFLLNPDSLIFDTGEPINGPYLPRQDGGKEIDFQLSEPINGVNSAHFLINSGNSNSIYARESIGEIRLVFKDAPPIVVDLVLGQNIREWCPGHSGDYIRVASSPSITMDVWMGLSKDGANAVMDCLRIPVYECMRNCFLEKITFVYKSVRRSPDTVGVHFSVFAVSLEIEQHVQS